VDPWGGRTIGVALSFLRLLSFSDYFLFTLAYSVGVSCEKDQEIKRAESWIRSKTTGENGRESHALTSQLRRRGIVPSLFRGAVAPRLISFVRR